ncbi:hypothetical protein T484DRAFT_1926528, partial [Baffinella frigidus]
MHSRAMQQDPAQQRHQQVVEDLVNDLLCLPSSFVSTTPDPRLSSSFVSTTAETPHRRRRQRPTHRASSCIPLDSPLAHPPDRASSASAACTATRTSSGASAACTASRTSSGASAKTTTPTHTSLRAHSRERSHPRATSRGPALTTSPKHDSLRSHSGRKLVATHKWVHDLPPASSAGRHTLLYAPYDGQLNNAKADTSEDASPLRRSRSRQLQKANSRRQLASLAPAPSRRDDTAVSSRHAAPRSVHLKSAAYALIAAFPTRTRDHEACIAVMNWENAERTLIRERKWQNAMQTSRQGSTRHLAGPYMDPGTGGGGSRGAVAPPVTPQASGKHLSTSTDTLASGQSHTLLLIRKHGFALGLGGRPGG